MSKVSYANLKLKIDTSVHTFDFNGTEVEVLNYLPIEEKLSLISIVLQNCKENGIYNKAKVDALFHLYLVYEYTNLSFTDKQREDEMKIYDTLQSNGFINMMLAHINEHEYTELLGYLNEQIEMELKYTTTAASVLNKFIDDLPAQADAMKNIIDNFDKEKYQEVVRFAEAANGNRPISARS